MPRLVNKKPIGKGRAGQIVQKVIVNVGRAAPSSTVRPRNNVNKPTSNEVMMALLQNLGNKPNFQSPAINYQQNQVLEAQRLALENSLKENQLLIKNQGDRIMELQNKINSNLDPMKQQSWIQEIKEDQNKIKQLLENQKMFQYENENLKMSKNILAADYEGPYLGPGGYLVEEPKPTPPKRERRKKQPAGSAVPSEPAAPVVAAPVAVPAIAPAIAPAVAEEFELVEPEPIPAEKPSLLRRIGSTWEKIVEIEKEKAAGEAQRRQLPIPPPLDIEPKTKFPTGPIMAPAPRPSIPEVPKQKTAIQAEYEKGIKEIEERKAAEERKFQEEAEREKRAFEEQMAALRQSREAMMAKTEAGIKEALEKAGQMKKEKMGEIEDIKAEQSRKKAGK